MISDILVESMVAMLEEMKFRDDLYTYVGNSFNGRNLKNMLTIKDVMNPEGMNMEFVSSRRVGIDDFHLFTKQDPPEILWAYMISCLVDGPNLVVNVQNLLDAPPDATLRRKMKSKKDGEGTSNPLPPFPAKKTKKSETSKNYRSADTEAIEVHKRVAI